jgi:hypothetical protein
MVQVDLISQLDVHSQVPVISQQDVHSQVPVSPTLSSIPTLLAVYIGIELNLLLRKATVCMFMAKRI